MRRAIRVVYERQRANVRGNPAAKVAFERGFAWLLPIFRDCLVENLHDRLRARAWQRALRSAIFLAREDPRRFGRERMALVRASLPAER